jgi:hypothetical protein
MFVKKPHSKIKISTSLGQLFVFIKNRWFKVVDLSKFTQLVIPIFIKNDFK